MSSLLARAGKSLESAARRLRPYLHPAYRKAFNKLVARGMAEYQTGQPVVCFDFSNPAIDAVGGRYYYSLVRDFMDAGFFPVLTARRSTVSTFGTSRVKSLLLDRPLGVVRTLDEIPGERVLVSDCPREIANIHVDYEARVASKPDEIAFPVFVHPRIAESTPLPFEYDHDQVRPVRLFFGGNTEEGKYDGSVLRDVYGMLTRREMLEVVTAAVTPARPKDTEEVFSTNRPFVLCETQVCPIPPARWLEALSHADFFLACPGVGMPLCHNLVEAMAAGSIPILQYSRYLSPPLRNGIECLAFDSAGSLRELVGQVMNMEPAAIAALRAGVKAYYQEHFAPGSLARKLTARPGVTLLMNSYRVPR